MRDNLYVLLWKYSDGSGSGALRIFESKERAEEDLKLLSEQSSMRTFYIEEVPYFDE